MTDTATIERRRGIVLAFPVYTPRDYQALLDVSTDAEWLHPTVEAYNCFNQEQCQRFASAGFAVEVIEISAPALINWCRAEGIALDSTARHRFTQLMYALRERQAGHA